MMLEYDWGNPAAAAAAAMLYFGEEAGQERQVFDHYDHHGLAGDFFQQQQAQLATAALFSGPASGPCHQRYGLALPPVPTRIGLNLGVRTYFSSGSPEEELMVGRVSRRRARTARCQAEGCGADLTHAKHYHRRHKVCEFHSKASIVIAAGLSQRFCQQCSRFHVLSEFDQGKRSCRKRLADHNRRRRKSQDLTTATADSPNTTTAGSAATATHSPNPEKVLFAATSVGISHQNNNRGPTSPPTLIGCTTEPSSSVTRVSSPAPPPPPPLASRVPLGLGSTGVVAGPSGSSSTGTSPPSVSFLSHLGDFRGHDHRFPSWDETEEGSSMRGFFQHK